MFISTINNWMYTIQQRLAILYDRKTGTKRSGFFLHFYLHLIRSQAQLFNLGQKSIIGLLFLRVTKKLTHL